MSKLGIYCPDCKETVFSKHRHDWVPCSCWSDDTGVFVDGGDDYLRYGHHKAGYEIRDQDGNKVNQGGQ